MSATALISISWLTRGVVLLAVLKESFAQQLLCTPTAYIFRSTSVINYDGIFNLCCHISRQKLLFTSWNVDPSPPYAKYR